MHYITARLIGKMILSFIMPPAPIGDLQRIDSHFIRGRFIQKDAIFWKRYYK